MRKHTKSCDHEGGYTAIRGGDGGGGAGALHRLSSFKARVNPEYPSHVSVLLHKEGPLRTGGSFK